MAFREFHFVIKPQDPGINDPVSESEPATLQKSSVEASPAVDQPTKIPQADTIFSDSPQEFSVTMVTPMVVSHSRGSRGKEYGERVGETMRSAVSRRIAREATRAFGETPEEQAENFAKQFIESGESYDFMAQDLKKRGIRLGEDALKRLARKFEKRKDGTWKVESKAGRKPLPIDEDEVERLCIQEDWDGSRLARHFHCSPAKISTILTSRGIFRKGGPRPKPAELI